MNDMHLRTDPAARGPWHTLKVGEALAVQGSDGAEGLSSARAAERLRQAGPNEIEEGGGRTVLHILQEQVSSVLILILVFAAGLAAALGKGIDAIAIAAIAALRQMSAPQVRVARDGRVREIPSPDLVPGDVVLLEAGNVVPADARVIASVALRVQEAALMGESEPVEKTNDALGRSNLTVDDRTNMVFMGTAVIFGRGRPTGRPKAYSAGAWAFMSPGWAR